MDSLQITWNLEDTEINSPNILFWHMDDLENGIALALVRSEVEWKSVTSWVMVVVKDVSEEHIRATQWGKNRTQAAQEQIGNAKAN